MSAAIETIPGRPIQSPAEGAHNRGLHLDLNHLSHVATDAIKKVAKEAWKNRGFIALGSAVRTATRMGLHEVAHVPLDAAVPVASMAAAGAYRLATATKEVEEKGIGATYDKYVTDHTQARDKAVSKAADNPSPLNLAKAAYQVAAGEIENRLVQGAVNLPKRQATIATVKEQTDLTTNGIAQHFVNQARAELSQSPHGYYESDVIKRAMVMASNASADGGIAGQVERSHESIKDAVTVEVITAHAVEALRETHAGAVKAELSQAQKTEDKSEATRLLQLHTDSVVEPKALRTAAMWVKEAEKDVQADMIGALAAAAAAKAPFKTLLWSKVAGVAGDVAGKVLSKAADVARVVSGNVKSAVEPTVHNAIQTFTRKSAEVANHLTKNHGLNPSTISPENLHSAVHLQSDEVVRTTPAESLLRGGRMDSSDGGTTITESHRGPGLASPMPKPEETPRVDPVVIAPLPHQVESIDALVAAAHDHPELKTALNESVGAFKTSEGVSERITLGDGLISLGGQQQTQALDQLNQAGLDRLVANPSIAQSIAQVVRHGIAHQTASVTIGQDAGTLWESLDKLAQITGEPLNPGASGSGMRLVNQVRLPGDFHEALVETLGKEPNPQQISLAELLDKNHSLANTLSIVHAGDEISTTIRPTVVPQGTFNALVNEVHPATAENTIMPGQVTIGKGANTLWGSLEVIGNQTHEPFNPADPGSAWNVAYRINLPADLHEEVVKALNDQPNPETASFADLLASFSHDQPDLAQKLSLVHPGQVIKVVESTSPTHSIRWFEHKMERLDSQTISGNVSKPTETVAIYPKPEDHLNHLKGLEPSATTITTRPQPAETTPIKTSEYAEGYRQNLLLPWNVAPEAIAAKLQAEKEALAHGFNKLGQIDYTNGEQISVTVSKDWSHDFGFPSQEGDRIFGIIPTPEPWKSFKINGIHYIPFKDLIRNGKFDFEATEAPLGRHINVILNLETGAKIGFTHVGPEEIGEGMRQSLFEGGAFDGIRYTARRTWAQVEKNIDWLMHPSNTAGKPTRAIPTLYFHDDKGVVEPYKLKEVKLLSRQETLTDGSEVLSYGHDPRELIIVDCDRSTIDSFPMLEAIDLPKNFQDLVTNVLNNPDASDAQLQKAMEAILPWLDSHYNTITVSELIKRQTDHGDNRFASWVKNTLSTYPLHDPQNPTSLWSYDRMPVNEAFHWLYDGYNKSLGILKINPDFYQGRRKVWIWEEMDK